MDRSPKRRLQDFKTRQRHSRHVGSATYRDVAVDLNPVTRLVRSKLALHLVNLRT